MSMGGCATTSSTNQTSESVQQAVAEASYVPQSEAVRKEMTDAAAKLPSMVDLRDLDGMNYVTPVKLQYPYASCWTFGIAGAAEISFLHDNGLGVPAGTPNDIIDFSEKYISWFTRHAITKDEVRKGWVRASQVGEGTDLSVAEEEYVNIAYTLGGDAKYGTSLFAAGFGPYIESTEIDGWQPFAYLGKNGWRSNDTHESAESAEKRKAHYKGMKQLEVSDLIEQGVIKSEEEFDAWFESQWSAGHELYEESFNTSEYAEWDDWSIPLTSEYLTPHEVLDFKNSYNLLATQTSDGDTYNEAGIAAIKLELSRGHGVSIGFHADQSKPGEELDENGYMNTKTWAQYCGEEQVANHAVTVVGYDDDYPKESFTREVDGKTVEGSTPPANGAFIVKNSWGALTEEDKASATVNEFGDTVYQNPNANAWGLDDTGYFYLSYYDKSISSACSYEFYPIKDAKYEHVNYDQYDLLMTADYEATTGTTEIKSANVFDAEEDEYLFQISTLSIAPHTTVHYEIYKDVNDGDPCSGTLLEEGDSFKEYGGYQRIDLQNEYFLKKGDKYSVVITQSYEGEDGVTYAAPYAKFGNANLMFGVVGSKLKGIINQGESLLYADGKWTDMYDLKDGLREAVAKEALGEDIENSTLASLFPNGIDDFVVDNYPIKAYLVPADAHDE